MPIKGRRKLLYSRRTHDKRTYGLNVYESAITPIVKALFKHELEEAKKRIIITRNGKYMYNPSKEYLHFLKTHYKHIKTNDLW